MYRPKTDAAILEKRHTEFTFFNANDPESPDGKALIQATGRNWQEGEG